MTPPLQFSFILKTRQLRRRQVTGSAPVLVGKAGAQAIIDTLRCAGAGEPIRLYFKQARHD